MLASKFIETELNAYITNQRLIPQDNLVRLIAKAFEAYDEYKRLVSSDIKIQGYAKDHNSNPKGFINVGHSLTELNPRINQRLDQIDNNLYSCPDLDQDKTDPVYKITKINGQDI